MQIFEYPYVIITVLVLFFIILGAVGIYFAVRGVKTANGNEENDFVSLSKLERSFEKAGRAREDRTVLYCNVDLDKYTGLYSATKTQKIFSEIKHTTLHFFSKDEKSLVCVVGENFVIFAKSDEKTIQKDIDTFLDEINVCLLKYSARNIIDISIGSYPVFGTMVTFDEAMNRAKQAYMLAKSKKIPHAQWTLSSGKALEKKIKIENNIEKEIDNNRFFLEYQPVLDAKTKKIVGAEVLARLNSESEGILTPGSFLSAVDSVGISEKFDYYIFEKNCKWISNDKKTREKYKYTINFSRLTLCEPDFPEKIISILMKYELGFSSLAIEILEDKDITGDAKQQMMHNLSLLKDKGMSIMLDDFGSGYTAFSDLQSLDISVVKIDKSITHNSVTDTGFKILKNIIATANDIGYKTLCEGIETEEHEQAAINAGCDMLQGFYYYRPMPVSALEKVFETNI